LVCSQALSHMTGLLYTAKCEVPQLIQQNNEQAHDNCSLVSEGGSDHVQTEKTFLGIRPKNSATLYCFSLGIKSRAILGNSLSSPNGSVGFVGVIFSLAATK